MTEMTARQSDSSIVQEAYAERLKGLVDTFFLSIVQAPDNVEHAKEAFTKGVYSRVRYVTRLSRHCQRRGRLRQRRSTGFLDAVAVG